MSCGTKLEGRFHLRSELEDLSDKLEHDGEYRLARSVRHGDCLDDYDLRRAERSLEREGLSSNFDYRKESCHCSTEEGGEE